MVRPIRDRRSFQFPQRPDDAAVASPQADETSSTDTFETIVPFYHARVLEALDSQAASSLNEADLGSLIVSILHRLETASDAPPIGGAHDTLATRLVDEMRGLGPLGPLLRDPDVSDIMVNGLESVYIERGGRLSKMDVRFRDVDHLTHIAQRIAQNAGRRIDELSPMCDARLDDGSRVNIIAPPLAIDGAAISIRRFRKGGFTVAELANLGRCIPAWRRSWRSRARRASTSSCPAAGVRARRPC